MPINEKIIQQQENRPATFKQCGYLKALYPKNSLKYEELKPNTQYPGFKTNFKGYPDPTSITIGDASRLIEEWVDNTDIEQPSVLEPQAKKETIVSVKKLSENNEGEDILWD